MAIDIKNLAGDTLTALDLEYTYFPGYNVLQLTIECDVSTVASISFETENSEYFKNSLMVAENLSGVYTRSLDMFLDQSAGQYDLFIMSAYNPSGMIYTKELSEAYTEKLYDPLFATMSIYDSGETETLEYRVDNYGVPNFDLKEQQQDTIPNLIIGPKSKLMIDILEEDGQEVDAWYVPQAWMDQIMAFELEERVFPKVKCFIIPQQRTITSSEEHLPGYDYDTPAIVLSPIGPDGTGYITNEYNLTDDFKGTWYFVLPNNRVYAANRLQAVKIGEETVYVHGYLFLQTNLCVDTLGDDKRTPVVGNAFSTYPRSEDDPGTEIDPKSWGTATDTGPDVGHNKTYKGFLVEEWTDPATDTFTTSEEVAWGIPCHDPTGPPYFWMYGRDDQFNWWGYLHIGASFWWIVDWVLQVYEDEDCTIPVTINPQDTAHATTTVPGWYTKHLRKDADNYIDAAGSIILTALGDTIVVSGKETIPTPTKLYVRYRPNTAAGYASVKAEYVI